MSIGQYIQLALLFAKIVNWITRKIDQTDWEASGYRKSMADELAEINASVGIATASFEEAAKATPEERRRSLKEPI